MFPLPSVPPLPPGRGCLPHGWEGKTPSWPILSDQVSEWPSGQVSMSTGFGPDGARPLDLLGDLEQARQLPDCEKAVVIPIVLR